MLGNLHYVSPPPFSLLLILSILIASLVSLHGQYDRLMMCTGAKFVNILVPNTYPIRDPNRDGLQRGWGSLARANAPLMQAIITTTATCRAMGIGEPIRPSNRQRFSDPSGLSGHAFEALAHKAETIKSINQKLADPAEAASVSCPNNVK